MALFILFWFVVLTFQNQRINVLAHNSFNQSSNFAKEGKNLKGTGISCNIKMSFGYPALQNQVIYETKIEKYS